MISAIQVLVAYPQLELAVLVYVRAIREGDYKLYVDALT